MFPPLNDAHDRQGAALCPLQVFVKSDELDPEYEAMLDEMQQDYMQLQFEWCNAALQEGTDVIQDIADRTTMHGSQPLAALTPAPPLIDAHHSSTKCMFP